MKCSCGGNITAKFPYLAKPLCKNCFCSLIERRVRRELKKVVEKDTILLVDDCTKEFAVLKFLMPKIVHMPAKLTVGRRKINGYNKIVANSCLDDVIIEYLAAFFTTAAITAKISENKEQKNQIFPLKNVLEEEIELFAKIKKLKFSKKKQRNKYQQQLKLDLDGLEKRFPGSKFSLLKSFEQIEDAA